MTCPPTQTHAHLSGKERARDQTSNSNRSEVLPIRVQRPLDLPHDPLHGPPDHHDPVRPGQGLARSEGTILKPTDRARPRRPEDVPGCAVIRQHVGERDRIGCRLGHCRGAGFRGRLRYRRRPNRPPRQPGPLHHASGNGHLTSGISPAARNNGLLRVGMKPILSERSTGGHSLMALPTCRDKAGTGCAGLGGWGALWFGRFPRRRVPRPPSGDWALATIGPAHRNMIVTTRPVAGVAAVVKHAMLRHSGEATP